MKNFHSILLLVLLSTVSVFAQTTAEDFFRTGRQQQQLNNYDAAISAFSECIRLRPDAIGCYQNRASTLLSKSKSEPLKAVGITADALMGKTNQKINLGGGSEVRNETRLKALADVNKVIELQPKFTSAYFLRAQIYDAELLYEKAITDFRYGTTLEPKYSEWAKIEISKAEKSYAVRLRSSAGAMATSAVFADQAGDKAKAAESYREAIDLYTKASELDKTNAANLTGRARVYRNLKNYEAAIADYTGALQIKPDDGDAMIERAGIYAEQKKTTLALADFEKAVGLPVTSSNKVFIQLGLIGRGKISLDAGQTDAAIADFDRVLAADQNYVMAFFYRGQAHAKKKNKPLAIADLRKALAISPDYAEAAAELKKLGGQP